MKSIYSLLLSVALLAGEHAAAAPIYDLAIGANKSARTLSVGAARRHVVWERLLLGYGLRASLLSGDLELYPVRVDRVEDRLTIESARLAMLNANIHAAVKVTEPFEIGFNLDIVGVSVGSAESAVYRATAFSAPVRVGASPSRGNLFLFGSNDRGSLNSEWYAAWRLTPAFVVRAGLSHFLSEYRADRELNSGTRLFRQFSNLAFVAARWTP